MFGFDPRDVGGRVLRSFFDVLTPTPRLGADDGAPLGLSKLVLGEVESARQFGLVLGCFAVVEGPLLTRGLLPWRRCPGGM